MNPNDFDSVHLKVTMTNNTTRTQIKEGVLYFGGTRSTEKHHQGLELKVLELEEAAMLLDIPSKLCAIGHNLTVQIETLNHQPKIVLTTSTKVEKITPSEGKQTEQILVKLVQFDEQAWESLKELFWSSGSDR